MLKSITNYSITLTVPYTLSLEIVFVAINPMTVTISCFLNHVDGLEIGNFLPW